MTVQPIRVLFVCLGNICRSPTAEGVFRHLVREAGLEDRFEIDSAGMGAWHAGDAPDRRATEAARRRGVVLSGKARQVKPSDLRRFDYVVAMDADNYADLEALREAKSTAELRRFREFDPEASGDLDVPDPYYGGPDGFDRVFDIVLRSARGLLEHIRRERDV